jgi:hypothetical protein
VPFGAPYKGFGIYNTEYRTVANLNAKRYYFELTNSPNVICEPRCWAAGVHAQPGRHFNLG